MPTQVAYLGPKGTYAEQAAGYLAKLEKLSQPEFIPCCGLRSVIEHLVNKHCEAAVVPIENSVEGGVTTTLDSLWAHPNLFIQRALVLPIRHAFISSGSLNEITEVLSHPQALAQCTDWLSNNVPNAIQLPTNSTSEAVRMVKGSKFRAAIASKTSSEVEGLENIAYPINDVAGNCTRFVLLTNQKSDITGDIASFAFSLHANKPGALLKALTCIADLGLNMNRIESRPSKRELGEYIFFVDIDLQEKSIDTKDRLNKLLKPLCENIIYFGSYVTSEMTLD
ncbi:MULTISPECIES: prephenate dehydratase [Prochlorococcus]|uniref:Prephenate dehydratase n=1 Tax=Prochlorococcus marinus (strain SARG / CCMP1375 / SS120) TaxID=167539 RepID=Q7VA09_PROMA|nr:MULTISPECIES: prephenate dehydratase [Prochlorococcus]AAQ00704.1 Prephenate dehydratase [Prochlorococcus marinus subsp. marinus str. CCMP1375]KGG10800.1 Prephenate dehydratase [Prochlorococcus marinus str. LG]KGG20148.1 Prephenate dehydratase [Prochlorococcus marinus str. SS2]KGG24048.1 Prephenate dehydratase [Prochlorococcus marinus str. SS35]KGG31693.1 Prephenate dehydratase [Prochlorococcus marinus str. SS51]